MFTLLYSVNVGFFYAKNCKWNRCIWFFALAKKEICIIIDWYRNFNGYFGLWAARYTTYIRKFQISLQMNTDTKAQMEPTSKTMGKKSKSKISTEKHHGENMLIL